MEAPLLFDTAALASGSTPRGSLTSVAFSAPSQHGIVEPIPKIAPAPATLMRPTIIMRDYQGEAQSAIGKFYREGIQRQLVSLPTGMGKTVLFSSLPEYLGLDRFDVTLVIAHVEELIDQAVASFKEMVDSVWVDKEKAEHRAQPMARVVVASIQTLKGKRLDEFFKRFGGRIKLLVIDEAHRSAAPSYRRLIDRVFADNPNALLVGVTATPRRSDNVGLDVVYDRIVYHLDIRTAIEMGYLVPMTGYRLTTNTSLEAVRTKGGDYDQGELAKAVDTDARNKLIVEKYRRIADGRLAVVFAASVEHAHHMTQAFNEAGYPAATIWGELDPEERKKRIDAFRRGDLRVLTNYGVLVEGFDVKAVGCVILARPTKSGVVYTQSLGRGLRPADDVARLLGTETTAEQRRDLIANSSKPDCVILDVVDVSKRHSPLTLPTIFGLPPNVDPKGRRIMQVVEQFEKLSEKDPELAKTASTMEDMEAALEQVDLWKVPQLSSGLQDVADLTWREIREGAYRLLIPRHTIAKDTDGKRIPRFETRVQTRMRQLETEDRAAGIFDETAEDRKSRVYAELRVDMQTLRVREGAVEIRNDALGRFEVWHLMGSGEERLLKDNIETITDAFARTEAWIRQNFDDVLNRVDSKAAWRVEQITPKQKRRLKLLGVPERHHPKTKGDASTLIDHLIEKKKKDSHWDRVMTANFSAKPPEGEIRSVEAPVREPSDEELI